MPRASANRQLRHAALSVAVSCVAAYMCGELGAFVLGTSMNSASGGAAVLQSRLRKQPPRMTNVAMHAEDPSAAMFQIFDASKLLLDPVLILQCVAAISLVVVGNILIQKEEEEEAEKEKELEEARANAVPAADGEECDIQVKEAAEEDFDIWRDSNLRYLGYSNELGEAIRPLVPAAYLGSYALAFAYVFADSIDKGLRADKKSKIAAARKAFIQLDTNCDGKLSKDEVRFAFGKLKMPMSEQQIDAYFMKLDSITPNDQIEVDEFMAAYERRDKELTDLLEVFEKANNKDGKGPLDNPSLVASADALIWQIIASVALPGFTINRFVTLAGQCCEGQASPLAEYFPTVLGLAMIPLVCKPLDVLADAGLDATLRPIIFASLDADKSGTIEYSEIASKMEKMDAKFDKAYLRQLFDEIDISKTGTITIEDWSNGGYQKYRAALEK